MNFSLSTIKQEKTLKHEGSVTLSQQQQQQQQQLQQPSIKTRLAFYIPTSDIPYMIFLPLHVTRITLSDIKKNIHQLAFFNKIPSSTQCHYFFKRRLDDSEQFMTETNFVFEKVDNDHLVVPNLDGTIVCKLNY